MLNRPTFGGHITEAVLFLVPFTEVFSNQMLEDLEKIWALRFIIPDPTNPFLSTIPCATEVKE